VKKSAAKSAVAAREQKIDPTLPFTEIDILGTTYKMCFTFRAIAKANERLRKQGVVVNLLWALPSLTMEDIPVVLAAALGTFHPEMTFDEIVALLDWDTIFDVRDKIIEAWSAAYPKRDEKDDKQNPPTAVLS
jgi:hypothetical protein